MSYNNDFPSLSHLLVSSNQSPLGNIASESSSAGSSLSTLEYIDKMASSVSSSHGSDIVRLAYTSSQDPLLCEYYAGFASGKSKETYLLFYWLLFSVNIVLLFLAARVFIWSQEALARRNKGSPSNGATTLPHLITIGMIFLVSFTILIIEIYPLLSLQFCSGEPLISLYWTSWTVLQLGTAIAILGVFIALVHTRRGTAPPPWGLPLGTPILVTAASYHILSDALVEALGHLWRRLRGIEDDDGKKFGKGVPTLPLSQVNTIQVSEPPSPISEHGSLSDAASIANSATTDGASIRSASPEPLSRRLFGNQPVIGDAEIVGFTLEGGPIVRLARSIPREMWGNPELVAMGEGDMPLLFFGKDGLRYETRAPEEMV